jgi:hypothetical protein
MQERRRKNKTQLARRVAATNSCAPMRYFPLRSFPVLRSFIHVYVHPARESRTRAHCLPTRADRSVLPYQQTVEKVAEEERKRIRV